MCSFAKTSNLKTESKLQERPRSKTEPKRSQTQAPLPRTPYPRTVVPIKARRSSKSIIYSRPISQLGLYEWIQNNSTLKSTKPGHTTLNANKYGRNGHLKINWKSIEILVDSKL